MSTLTAAEQQKIADWLADHDLTSGVGSRHAACSVAAINLALTGELTDKIPDCMSPTIGHWIIRMQDAMPAELRNSAKWKRLLPLAAGTGQKHEKERHAIILDWMWTTVLPQLQCVADAEGYGDAWSIMCEAKTSARAYYAAAAARAAGVYLYAVVAAARSAAAAYTDAAAAANAAAYASTAAAARADASAAAKAAAAAAYAAAAVYDATDAAERTAAYAAAAVYDATDAAVYDATDAAVYDATADAVYDATAAAAAVREQYWHDIDPCAVLARLVAVTE